MKTTTRPILKSKLTRLSLAAFLALPMVANATSYPITIDNFSAGSMGNLTGTGSFSESVAGVLGGVREVEYSFLGNANSNSLYLDLGLLTSATNKNIGVYTLTYDGLAGSNNVAGNLNLDLTTAFAINVRASADFWSQGSSTSQMSVALTDNLNVTRFLSLTPGIAPYDFGDITFALANSAFDGLAKNHISRISVSYTSAISADTDFDSISIQNGAVALPVPEADSALFLLMGMGLVGYMARRRG